MRSQLPQPDRYGAAELQAYEPRALLISFLLSAVVVQSLAMLISWWSASPTVDPAPKVFRPGMVPYRIVLNPPIAPIPLRPGMRRAGVIPTLAIPVPVADQPAESTSLFPTTEELLTFGSEEGEVLVSGAELIETGTPVEETEPAPFEPRQVEPAVVVKVDPVYPPIAIRAGLEGNVFIQVWVDTKGSVRRAVVVKSDGDIFNDAAIEAVRKWIFTPALMQDRPVSVWVTIPIRFRLSIR